MTHSPYVLQESEKQLYAEFKNWLKNNLPSKEEQKLWKAPVWHERWSSWKRWQEFVYEAGWMGVSWPKQWGGKEASLITEFLIGEELARLGAPHSANWISLAAMAQAILNFGSEAQKEAYLPKIARGDETWCLGVTEPDAGSDVMRTATRAELKGDHFVVNGKKIWSTHSPWADKCLLLVRTDPRANPEWALSMLVVDLKSPGVEVNPLRQLHYEENYGEMIFENVEVPKENVIGEINSGWIVQASTWLAESIPPWDVPHRLGLQELLRSLRTHQLDDEAVDLERLGELVVEAEMVRLTTVRALRSKMSRGALPSVAPLVKVAFTEVSQKITEAGLDWSRAKDKLQWSATPEKWLYRHVSARSNTIARAPSEIHRNFVAHYTLGMPR